MKWIGRSIAVGALGFVLAAMLAAAEPAKPEVRRGEVRFAPDPKEQEVVPKQFRLDEGTFKFEETMRPSTSENVKWSFVTFPSPVHTDSKLNNTVHCEYCRPAAAGKYPACVVLHILGGDFALSRAFASALAEKKVAALFLIMPYYGPRRDPDIPTRMISPDPEETVRGMTQAVKDIRYATAWLAEQPEVDPQQLGIFGISLGGITATLAGEAEPRLHKVCPTLAGGGIADILWDAKEKHLTETRRRWEASGGTHQGLIDLMATVDPVTYADRLKSRKVLMLNAKNDEVIPRQCTDALWKAAGKPPIVWYDAGHITAAWHLLDAMQRVTDFFQPEAVKPEKEAAPAAGR